ARSLHRGRNGAPIHGGDEPRRIARNGCTIARSHRSRPVAPAPQRGLRATRGTQRKGRGGMKTDGMTEAEMDLRHAEKMAKKKAVRDKIMATKTIEKGLLIVNTGKGKGKSTAAFGMVCRAVGHGFKVGVVQFVKGRRETGERKLLAAFPDQVTMIAMGDGFTWETQDRQRDIAAAREAWNRAKEM